MGSTLARLGSSLEVEEPNFANRFKLGALAEVVENNNIPSNRSPIYRCAGISDEEHKRLCHEWYYGDNIMQQLEALCMNEDKKKKNAMAFRQVDHYEKEVRKDQKGREKTWELTYLKDPEYITYEELWQRVVGFGKGLIEIGLKKENNIAIYEETRWEWTVSAYSLWTQDMVGVTVYSNLGENSLIYALQEAECKAVICNAKNVALLIQLMRKASIVEAIIIYLDALPENLDTTGYTVIAWTEVLTKGLSSNHSYSVQKDNTKLALVMYTSGTVAEPKGVMHTLGSLSTGARALHDRLTQMIGPHQDGETYVSYLPSAHIFEFTCQNIFLLRGVLICYGSPRTLTDVSARPCGDLHQFEPFFFMGVPRIFETLKKIIESKLPPKGTLQRDLFDQAYLSRLQALRRGRDTPLLNYIFKLPRSFFGSRIRGICTGGAPMSDKVQEFMNVVFGVPFAQGYGLTETCCNAAVQRCGELYCEAGQLLRTVEAYLFDTDDYHPSDTPHPRGELCLRGFFLFQGYYKQNKLTQEVFHPDGFFRTGDVAEFHAHTGQLKIIGRVKALAKNALGEYLSLEFLDALYSHHPLATANGVCVLVHPQRSFITALVLTDEQKAMAFAQQHHLIPSSSSNNNNNHNHNNNNNNNNNNHNDNNDTSTSWVELLNNKLFHLKAAQSMAELAKEEGRRPFECLKRVRVLAEEWTPENNILTASMKIRRSQIDRKYAKIIEELFEEEEE